MPKLKINAAGYSVLLNRVRSVLIEGQARIEEESVRTYWEPGRIIHSHILKHKDRAEYGAEVMKQLAHDLNISQRVLERCIQFAKTYPRLPITAARPQFSWSHYRQLITIADDRKPLRVLLAKVRWRTFCRRLCQELGFRD